MKTKLKITGLTVLALAALTGTAPLTAQEAASAPASPVAITESAGGGNSAVQFRVEAERSVPIAGGGRLILQRVAEPVLPPPPPAVVPPLLTPEQRAARLAARQAASTMPRHTRLLWFNVTAHDDGLSYIEWWPDGGGGPFAAWTRADFRYMGMIPEFDLANTDTRYLLFPSPILRPRPGSTPAVYPAIPEDGPGFVLVKGDPANTHAVGPIAALHRLYVAELPSLKERWEERERLREAEAALPAPPPGDVVIKFWPLRSEAAPAPAAVPTTSGPSAQ